MVKFGDVAKFNFATSQIELYCVPKCSALCPKLNITLSLDYGRSVRMPRTARKRSSTDFYHVIGKGINNERIFNQTREKNNFKRLLIKYQDKYEIEIYSYVIMSTHFHILLRADLNYLSGYLACVLAEFAEYYNYKHNRNGHVFQNRFTSECVENPQYFWNCMKYIHMNPVNANITKNPLKYNFSSLREYETEKSKILHPKAIKIYKSQFTDFEEYLEFHQKGSKNIFIDIPEDIEAQQKKFALATLCQEAHLQNLASPKEVIENRYYREKFKEKLQKELHLSKRKTERLYHYVKRCIIGK